MVDWRHVLLHAALDAEAYFDRCKRRLRERLGHEGHLLVIPYRTYGTPERLYVKGRVLQDRGVRSAREDDDVWDNLLNMYRRFDSNEMPGAHVIARYGDQTFELVADEEGFIEGWLPTGVEPGTAAPSPATPVGEEPPRPSSPPSASAGEESAAESPLPHGSDTASASPGTPVGAGSPRPNSPTPTSPHPASLTEEAPDAMTHLDQPDSHAARPPITPPAALDRTRMAPRTAEGASHGLWRQVELELAAPRPAGNQVQATAYVLVPPPGARLGVISDIDDTVVRTDATSFLRMARTVFLGNARLRLPFEGVAAFYRALHAGASGHDLNPLFYISNSPWNMYDLFSDFFQMQDIPVGPVLILRDWGLTHEGLAPLHPSRFKLAAIRQIMDVYPQLPFILVGDSGEHDPEIYERVVAQYPGRIMSVYIRNVSTKPKRVDAIHRLAERVVAAGSTLILADNTLPLARHAAAQGWIDPAALPRVQAAKAADEAPPTPVEELLGVEVPKRPKTPTVVIEDKVPSPEKLEKVLDAGQGKT